MHREILIIMTMIAVYQQQQQPMTKRTRSASVTKAAEGAAIAAIIPGLSPVASVVAGSSVVGSSVVGGGSGLATTNDTFIPNRLAYK